MLALGALAIHTGPKKYQVLNVARRERVCRLCRYEVLSLLPCGLRAHRAQGWHLWPSEMGGGSQRDLVNRVNSPDLLTTEAQLHPRFSDTPSSLIINTFYICLNNFEAFD